MQEISLNDFDDVYFGNAQDDTAKTGVTVAIFPKGALVGVDISDYAACEVAKLRNEMQSGSFGAGTLTATRFTRRRSAVSPLI